MEARDFSRVRLHKTQIKVTSSLFGGKQIHFCGVPSSNQLKKMKDNLDIVLKQVLKDIAMYNPISDYDKLKCIYEYLQDHVVYDIAELEACCRYEKSQNPLSHNAYGALVEKKAVCDGISAAFSLIAQSMGFECAMVNGTAAFRTEGFSSHTWNVVRIGKKYYHLDVTWDISHKETIGEYSYSYFCVDDDIMNTDHNWKIHEIPLCNSNEMSFYIHNKCFAYNLSQVDEIFRRYAKSKTKVVRLKVSDTIEIPEQADRFFAQRLIDIGTRVGRRDAIRFVWSNDTRCFLAKYV